MRQPSGRRRRSALHRHGDRRSRGSLPARGPRGRRRASRASARSRGAGRRDGSARHRALPASRAGPERPAPCTILHLAGDGPEVPGGVPRRGGRRGSDNEMELTVDQPKRGRSLPAPIRRAIAALTPPVLLEPARRVWHRRMGARVGSGRPVDAARARMGPGIRRARRAGRMASTRPDELSDRSSRSRGRRPPRRSERALAAQHGRVPRVRPHAGGPGAPRRPSVHPGLGWWRRALPPHGEDDPPRRRDPLRGQGPPRALSSRPEHCSRT